jgi:Ca2+-binding RTX toxin-like protein
VLGGAANGITTIKRVIGGQGNNLLVGVGTGVYLSAAFSSGMNILIGGGGQATLVGGAGSDLLIAGSTSYDRNATALNALLAYWTDPTLTLDQRINGLSAGIAGRYKLNASTAQHATAADTLTLGSSDNDWVFVRDTGPLADTITDYPTNTYHHKSVI